MKQEKERTMRVVNTGRSFMITLSYVELVHGFKINRVENIILDASQIEVSECALMIRRKGRGRGTAEYFAQSMVQEFREIRR